MNLLAIIQSASKVNEMSRKREIRNSKSELNKKKFPKPAAKQASMWRLHKVAQNSTNNGSCAVRSNVCIPMGNRHLCFVRYFPYQTAQNLLCLSESCHTHRIYVEICRIKIHIAFSLKVIAIRMVSCRIMTELFNTIATRVSSLNYSSAG